MYAKNILLLCAVGASMAAAQNLLGELDTEVYEENLFIDERDERSQEQDEDNADLTEDERQLERQLAAASNTPKDRNFFKSDYYQNQLDSAQAKLDLIWSVIGPDSETEGNDEPMGYYYKEFNQTLHENSNNTFCNRSDEMRRNRLKTTHTQGVVAKILWEVVDNDMGYTGLYKDGSTTAVMRLSQTSILTDHSQGLFPSIAIKFLLDKGESRNLFGLPNFHGTESWDFLGQDFKSRVDPLSVKDHSIEIDTIIQKLIEGSNRPFATGVSGPAMFLQSGEQLDNGDVGSPYEIVFKPVDDDDVHFPEEGQTDEDGNRVSFLDQLSTIKKGKKLFEVHARAEPESLDGGLQHIANIVLDSDLQISLEGDRRLFFRHDRVQQDYKYWPKRVRNAITDPVFVQKNINKNEWPFQAAYDSWPTENDDEAMELFEDQVGKFGCPFGWLLNLY